MKWQKYAIAAGDFALSVLLSAFVFWLVWAVAQMIVAFTLWRPYEAPGWLAFRVSLVVALYHQARGAYRRAHRERKAQ